MRRMKKIIKVTVYTGLVALVSSSATAHYYAFKNKNKSLFPLFGALKNIASEPPPVPEVELPDSLANIDFKSLGSAVEDFFKELETEFKKDTGGKKPGGSE